MTILDETSAIERLRFFPGQRLAAAEMQGIESFQREMRWLHNRSLHQPGIGNGYAISGKKGDREVTIQPGYAIDIQGREIVLVRDHVEPVPPVAGDTTGGPAVYDLVVSYPAAQDLEEAETREGVCLPRGVIRLREEPLFCWVQLRRNGETGTLQAVDTRLGDEVAAGSRIRLARIEVENCKLKRDISTAQRRSARPPQLPRITAGQDGADWTVPGFSLPTQESFVLSATVSTETTFTNAPYYMARVAGEQPLWVQSDPFFAGPLVVQEARVDQFSVLLWVLSPTTGASEAFLAEAKAKWTIVWIGVEE